MSLTKREIIRGSGVDCGSVDPNPEKTIPEDCVDVPLIPPDDSVTKKRLKTDKFKPNSPYGKIFRKTIKNKRLFKCQHNLPV